MFNLNYKLKDFTQALKDDENNKAINYYEFKRKVKWYFFTRFKINKSPIKTRGWSAIMFFVET